MNDIEKALAEALRTSKWWLPTTDGGDQSEALAGHILVQPEMQEWQRQFAKDCGAAGYAEGLHDAETNPERDRGAAHAAALAEAGRILLSLLEDSLDADAITACGPMRHALAAYDKDHER